MPDDRLPYMPIYVHDLMGSPSVQLMSCEERGAYLWLLLVCWANSATLPDDDADLAALCKLPALPDRVRRQFGEHPDAPGMLTNRRLYREYHERAAKRAKQSRAATIAANARWHGDGQDDMPPATETECETHAKGNAKRIASHIHIQNHIQKNTPPDAGAGVRETPAPPAPAGGSGGVKNPDTLTDRDRFNVGVRLSGPLRAAGFDYVAHDACQDMAERLHAVQRLEEAVGFIRHEGRQRGRCPAYDDLIASMDAGRWTLPDDNKPSVLATGGLNGLVNEEDFLQ